MNITAFIIGNCRITVDMILKSRSEIPTLLKKSNIQYKVKANFTDNGIEAYFNIGDDFQVNYLDSKFNNITITNKRLHSIDKIDVQMEIDNNSGNTISIYDEFEQLQSKYNKNNGKKEIPTTLGLTIREFDNLITVVYSNRIELTVHSKLRQLK